MAHDVEFTGSVPELYERLMVPMIFTEPAASLARRVASAAPARIVETAAGTGVLTAALLDACPGAEVLATDVHQPMLDRAESTIGTSDRVRFQQADALDLPVDDAWCDVVVCQFGVMFFPDRVRGHREAHRVLRPGGSLVLAVWESLATNDFARVVDQALRELTGDDSLDFMARVPHGYADTARIEDDVLQAGFASLTIEQVRGTSTATADDAAVAYCQGTPLRAAIEAHPRVSLVEATRIAAEALRREFGPGVMTGRTGWIEAAAVAH
ncbi:SAM-dependent methyltransferase [Blastococcus sp. TF02-8]|uniref:class I SAM-dependent methyltransferase n=1 Tax=Blastococcus sp. TF02-8 TaxID=2250574 RepID=UPI000DE995B0|nr:class I SAM-dependent methyltransferase [Blastococcus sp. TF02-8]RBY97785.1 SAM-dependent methyltransferase [Blastococcus sp. TF02-8]